VVSYVLLFKGEGIISESGINNAFLMYFDICIKLNWSVKGIDSCQFLTSFFAGHSYLQSLQNRFVCLLSKN
jgi:hypothetical protein